MYLIISGLSINGSRYVRDMFNSCDITLKKTNYSSKTTSYKIVFCNLYKLFEIDGYFYIVYNMRTDDEDGLDIDFNGITQLQQCIDDPTLVNLIGTHTVKSYSHHIEEFQSE